MTAKIKLAAARRFASVDEGEDLRLEGDDVVGSALVKDERLVHLAAFAVHRGMPGRGAEAHA